MTITLYDMPESPHARKVRLLAAELGIPLNCVAPRSAHRGNPLARLSRQESQRQGADPR